MNERYAAAIELLGSFTRNQPVQVTDEDGNQHDMYVAREIHRGTFGVADSSRILVTRGPGYGDAPITADMLALGIATIEAR